MYDYYQGLKLIIFKIILEIFEQTTKKKLEYHKHITFKNKIYKIS